MVRELRKAVMVRMGHEHDWLKVEGLAGTCEAACITHEACVHLACGREMVTAGCMDGVIA